MGHSHSLHWPLAAPCCSGCSGSLCLCLCLQLLICLSFGLAATKQLARKSTKTDFQKQEATAATLPLTDMPLEPTASSYPPFPCPFPTSHWMYPHIDFVRGARKRFWDLRNKSLVPQRANLQPQWQTANQSTHTLTYTHTNIHTRSLTYTHTQANCELVQTKDASVVRPCRAAMPDCGYFVLFTPLQGRVEPGGQTDMALQGSLVFGHHL